MIFSGVEAIKTICKILSDKRVENLVQYSNIQTVFTIIRIVFAHCKKKKHSNDSYLRGYFGKLMVVVVQASTRNEISTGSTYREFSGIDPGGIERVRDTIGVTESRSFRALRSACFPASETDVTDCCSNFSAALRFEKYAR